MTDVKHSEVKIPKKLADMVEEHCKNNMEGVPYNLGYKIGAHFAAQEILAEVGKLVEALNGAELCLTLNGCSPLATNNVRRALTHWHSFTDQNQVDMDQEEVD